MAVIIPPERKLAKCTFVQCGDLWYSLEAAGHIFFACGHSLNLIEDDICVGNLETTEIDKKPKIPTPSGNFLTFKTKKRPQFFFRGWRHVIMKDICYKYIEMKFS